MTVHLPLILLVALVGYLGVKLLRPPLWLVAVLLLGGYLLADTVLAPAVDSGARTGVEIVNGTTK